MPESKRQRRGEDGEDAAVAKKGRKKNKAAAEVRSLKRL